MVDKNTIDTPKTKDLVKEVKQKEIDVNNEIYRENESVKRLEYGNKLVNPEDIEKGEGGSLSQVDTSALQNVYPAADSLYDLGNSAPKYWKGGYFDNLYLNNTASLTGSVAGTLGSSGNIVPVTDNIDDLGSASKGYKNVYVKTGLHLPVLTDATRGAAGTAGRVIFNSDDGNMNIDTGSAWILPDGTTT